MLEARRLAHHVMLANRRYSLVEAYCLVESLALWWMLRRRGLPAEFRLGVRTITGPLESHAWVELDGTALNDAEDVGDIFEAFDLSAICRGSESP